MQIALERHNPPMHKGGVILLYSADHTLMVLARLFLVHSSDTSQFQDMLPFLDYHNPDNMLGTDG